MSPDAMQNWMIAVALIAACLLGTFIIRFLARCNDKHLQRVADAEANRGKAADDK